jgi:hypothetical protein
MPINNVTLPHTITPSTLADASQVQANDEANENKLNEVISVVNALPTSTLNQKGVMNLLGGTIVPPFSAGQNITVGLIASPIIITSANSNVEMLWKIKVGDKGLPTQAPFAPYGALADFTLEKSTTSNFATSTVVSPNVDGYYREKISISPYNTAGVNTPIIDLPYLDTQLAIGTYYYRIRCKIKDYAGADLAVATGANLSFEGNQGTMIFNITQG